MVGIFAQETLWLDRQECLVPHSLGSRRFAGFRNRIDDYDRPMKMNLLEAIKQGMACEFYNFVPKRKQTGCL
jgi:hypothetical protein